MPQSTESEQLTTADLANVMTGRTERREERELDRSEIRQTGTSRPEEQYSGPLLPQGFSDDMRTRWETIQAGFVDDPRVAVQEADELVAMAIKKLAESFAGERGKLEGQWSQGNDVSTEDLRQALRRYRAFFHRLLSI